ncbi:MAG: methionine--tRNA ligase [Proteobacteria bacterium]|nr:methionine--tRNA ligase [Cystobacterineae bacterium]MCL2259578.1 methionine--tRNA ligase [Cystobacterineae bacterium]MCL2313939.1 methionine--tRNA ligase [Pseudomonadota bacterium]
MSKLTLVTCALPYANGPLHLGHMVENIQADIFVRFLRSMGNEVVFLCADDTHGTPIELKALEKAEPPEVFVQRFFEEHQKDFVEFDISHDMFGSTHNPENQFWSNEIYARLKQAGHIARRDIEQAFDEHANRFLPDRFVKGTCPRCKAPEQYGDVCEKCGAIYRPRELIDARSALTRKPCIWKSSEHLFFELVKFEAFLKELLSSGFVSEGIAAQLQQFFEKGLADWDISRDGPYFGFPIPGEDNKFFYVWLDAPIGYISMTDVWAKQKCPTRSAQQLWSEEADTRIIHFIGKDIVYFHCLFWPAILHVANLKLPQRVHVHGFLTVNGEKMSKTRGTFIEARKYLNHLDPNYLRFYLASLLGPGHEDLDFSLKEFRQRTNAELVNNLGNLAQRTLSLLSSPALQGKLAVADGNAEGRRMVEAALAKLPHIKQAFEAVDLRQAMKLILEIGSEANLYLTQQAPWKWVKEDVEAARAVLSETAETLFVLSGLLWPVVPKLAQKLAAQLNVEVPSFQHLLSASYPLLDRTRPLGPVSPLIARMEASVVDALVSSSKTP